MHRPARRRAAQEEAEDKAYAAEQEAALLRLKAEKAALKARQQADIEKLKARIILWSCGPVDSEDSLSAGRHMHRQPRCRAHCSSLQTG